MKQLELKEKILQTPVMRAVFKVTVATPRLVRLGIKKGDLFYYHPNGCYVPVNSGCLHSTNLHAGGIEFVEYRDMNDRWNTGNEGERR
jgi:hypothetical protein